VGRPDLTPVLDRLETPTLLTTNADDPMWTIAAAQAAQAAPDVAALVTAFWGDPRGQAPQAFLD
jgi:hypothetical protein